jgi:hypothetical protein
VAGTAIRHPRQARKERVPTMKIVSGGTYAALLGAWVIVALLASLFGH